MHSGMNVIALVKESERYVFLYDDSSPQQLLEQLGKHAADPELNFTWYDAAILSQKVRRTHQGSSRSQNTSEVPEFVRGSLNP